MVQVATKWRKTFKNLTSRRRIAVGIALVAIYVALRLSFLLRYPIFNDESIHLRFGQIIWQTGEWRYSLLHSGKQPLPYLIYGGVGLVLKNQLLAGRLVSVGVGGLTWLLVTTLASRMYGYHAGLMTALWYSVLPMTVFFDRLVVVDNMLSLLFAALLNVLYGLRERWNVRRLLVIGLIAGIGLWVKTTGIVLLLVATAYLWYLGWQKRIRFIQIIFSAGTVWMLAIGCALPYLVQPSIPRTVELQYDHILRWSELSLSSVNRYWEHLSTIVMVLVGYGTPLLLVMPVYLLKNWSRNQKHQFLFYGVLVPILVMLPVARKFEMRYLLFVTIPLLILLGKMTLDHRVLGVGALVMASILTIVQLFDPIAFFSLYPRTGIFRNETWQYIENWTSGYGIREALQRIELDRNGRPAVILVRRDSGNPEDAVLLYASNDPSLIGGYLDSGVSIQSVLQNNPTWPLYFVTRANQPGNVPVELVPLGKDLKPNGLESVDTYRIEWIQ